jgi:hypothetical protein
MGHVRDTYLRYESAGDQFVGRTVAGLPLESPDFAILPPHFRSTAAGVVAEVVQECFPKSHQSLRNCLEMFLASVVYHSDYLKAKLPANHRLFSSPLFSTNRLSSLKPLVQCGRFNKVDEKRIARATGIPPFVSILCQVQDLAGEVKELRPVLSVMPQQVASHVNSYLQENAIEAKAVTPEMTKQIMRNILHETGLLRVVQALDNSGAVQLQSAPPAAPPPVSRTTDYAQFSFPNAPPRAAFQLWLCGDAAREYPPYRQLQPDQLHTSDLRKRLSDFRFLMHYIEKQIRAVEPNANFNGPSLTEVNRLYDLVESVVTPRTSNRREQAIWSTVVRHVRQRARIAAAPEVAEVVVPL